VKKSGEDRNNFYPKISSSEKREPRRFFGGRNNNRSSRASITLAVLLREEVVNLRRISLNVLFEEEDAEAVTFFYFVCLFVCLFFRVDVCSFFVVWETKSKKKETSFYAAAGPSPAQHFK
jgi:hypothetical protein